MTVELFAVLVAVRPVQRYQPRDVAEASAESLRSSLVAAVAVVAELVESDDKLAHRVAEFVTYFVIGLRGDERITLKETESPDDAETFAKIWNDSPRSHDLGIVATIEPDIPPRKRIPLDELPEGFPWWERGGLGLFEP